MPVRLELASQRWGGACLPARGEGGACLCGWSQPATSEGGACLPATGEGGVCLCGGSQPATGEGGGMPVSHR